MSEENHKDFDRVVEEVSRANRIIRLSGSKYGFSITMNKHTNVLEAVGVYPIPAIPAIQEEK